MEREVSGVHETVHHQVSELASCYDCGCASKRHCYLRRKIYFETVYGIRQSELDRCEWYTTSVGKLLRDLIDGVERADEELPPEVGLLEYFSKQDHD